MMGRWHDGIGAPSGPNILIKNGYLNNFWKNVSIPFLIHMDCFTGNYNLSRCLCYRYLGLLDTYCNSTFYTSVVQVIPFNTSSKAQVRALEPRPRSSSGIIAIAAW